MKKNLRSRFDFGGFRSHMRYKITFPTSIQFFFYGSGNAKVFWMNTAI